MSVLNNNTGNLVYLGEVTRTSKNGNQFVLVTIGDSVEMQRHEFFKDESCNTLDLKTGDPVNIELDIQTMGYNQRLNLKEIKKVVK